MHAPQSGQYGFLASWVVPMILGLTMAGIFGYFNNDKTQANDLTALKVQEANDHERLQRLEDTIGSVDHKIDTLLQWEAQGRNGNGSSVPLSR